MSDTARHFVSAGTPLPPPRPGVRHVRVPVGRRIVIADDDLRTRVDRLFHWPMIILALLILPLLAIDLILLQNHPERHGTMLWWFCVTGLAIIWLAFLVEFIIKIAIAECRIEYARRNWLDIVIIVMPMLRPLRVATVAKTTRAFTLRGVGMKFARYVFTAVIGLEATERMLQRIGIKPKVGRQDPSSMTRHQLVRELSRLRATTDAWEIWYEAQRAHIETQGDVGPLAAKPALPDAREPAGDDPEPEAAGMPEPREAQDG